MNLKYFAIGVARKPLPEKFLFDIMKWRGGVNAAESTPDSKFAEWQTHLQRRDITLADKTVVEIGSGRSARLALRMLAHGARRVILVDPYAVSLDDPAHRAMLLQDCAALGLAPDALAQVEIQPRDFLDVLPARSTRVDLVVSTAVLEHVKNPSAVLLHCQKWLVAGGQTHHIVDLRDHNAGFRYPLEMLTYSDAMWKNWLDLPGGFHLNRWRAGEYRAAMQGAGFKNFHVTPTQCDARELERVWAHVQPEFRAQGKQELSILGIDLYGENA